MKEEIRQITTEDKEYPKKLREIADPPQILYARGDLKAAERCFAIVGTRLCSPYGKQVAM